MERPHRVLVFLDVYADSQKEAEEKVSSFLDEIHYTIKHFPDLDNFKVFKAAKEDESE